MNIFTKITTWADKHTLLHPDQTIIIGLSGGPDSVFLLHYLLSRKEELNLNLIAAHLNHEWRPCANQDEAFCRALCAELNVTYVSSTLSQLACPIKPSGSKEQDARHARRFFFQQLAQKYNANAVALAHHKDDQEETFFIRLLRGATVTGLSCMWPRRDNYIRPLLCVTKQEICSWLAQHTIAYVTDPTNESPDYLRNRIRNELMPLLATIDNRAHINISKSIKHLQQTELFLQKVTTQTFATIALYDVSLQRYVITLPALFAQDIFMQYRLLIHWLTLEKVTVPASTNFLDEIVRFLHQPESKSHSMHHTWSIVKKKQQCHVQSNTNN